MKADDVTLLAPPFQAVVAALQENPIAQAVLFSLSIATAALEIAYRLYRWWKEARKDGKIDKEELEDLADIAGDAISKADDIIKKKKGDQDDV